MSEARPRGDRERGPGGPGFRTYHRKAGPRKIVSDILPEGLFVMK